MEVVTQNELPLRSNTVDHVRTNKYDVCVVSNGTQARVSKASQESDRRPLVFFSFPRLDRQCALVMRQEP